MHVCTEAEPSQAIILIILGWYIETHDKLIQIYTAQGDNDSK